MKLFRYIFIITIINLVFFFSLNEETPAWDLVSYAQYYIIVSGFIYLSWLICQDVLTRSLAITVGFYYFYELCMDIYKIIDPIKHEELYEVDTINYLLGLCMILALISYPIINRLIHRSHG